MTTAWDRVFFYESVACVCLTSGTIFLFIEFPMANGLLMAVMTITFGLPNGLHNNLSNSKNC